MKKIKIGIDFGKTIGDIMKNEGEIEYSIIAIEKIINRFGKNNIWIVSKAGEEMEKKIKNWLVEHNFYNLTGFLPSQIIFVKTHNQKREIVDKIKINYFIDDSYKNVREIYSSIYLDKFIWFKGNNRQLKDVPHKYRNKIIIINSWKKIYGYFSKKNIIT